MCGAWFRVEDLGFRVQGLGFRSVRCMVSGQGFRLSDPRFGIKGAQEMALGQIVCIGSGLTCCPGDLDFVAWLS